MQTGAYPYQPERERGTLSCFLAALFMHMLLGALLYYGKSRGGAYGSSVYREVSGWVISLFMFGLIFPGINNWGHGGGIIGGIIVAFVGAVLLVWLTRLIKKA